MPLQPQLSAIISGVCLMALCHHGIADTVKNTSASAYCGNNSPETAPALHHRNDLVAALTALPEAYDARRKTLNVVRQEATNSSDAAAHYLSDQATLLLAANALRVGDFKQARRELRAISLASPVAVDAGLLLAESWRLEYKPSKAQRWFLRIAATFPANPDALTGLLAAADDARLSNSPELANALYTRVLTLGAEYSASTDILQKEIGVAGIALLRGRSAHIPEDIQQQFIRITLEHPAIDVLNAKRVAQQARYQADCLAAHNAALARRLAELRQRLKSYSENQSYLNQEIEEDQQYFQTLHQRLRPGDLSEQQVQIRKMLTTLKNRIARRQTRRAFFEQTLARLPDMISQGEKEITQMLAQRVQIYSAASKNIDVALYESAARLKAIYQNITAEAYIGRGKLQEVKYQKKVKC